VKREVNREEEREEEREVEREEKRERSVIDSSRPTTENRQGATPVSNSIPLSIAWEESTFAHNRPVALEVTFTAPTIDEGAAPRLPLNVGLSIDRSGSMAGEKLAAARQAAIGVAESLRNGERLAATAFDSDVIDIAPSLALDDAVRARIAGRIREIHSGGSTALFDGFARAAELVASGGQPDESDSWVLVLSDGMGNHGLTDPAAMRVHAASLADRGIRTITVGIGDDYEAAQLTALAEGGAGEFHHATNPNEIVEIVLAELKALRVTSVRDLHITIGAHSPRWRLLGGEQYQHGDRRDVRFDRIAGGRTVRAVALFWPTGNGDLPRVSVDGSWTDRDGISQAGSMSVDAVEASRSRNIDLAVRAARIWHASIVARALELNEKGEHRRAESFVNRARRDFTVYVAGLPNVADLIDSLHQLAHRVGSEWRTTSHREAYVMARKGLMAREDLRAAKPSTFMDALRIDKK
jgi:Mg-chelatase subunit ChlD